MLERPGLDDARGDGVHPEVPRRELHRQVADDRLQRRLRRADEHVVLEHPSRAERGDADDRRARRHVRHTCAREREQGACVCRECPVPVLVLGLERRTDHARRRVVDDHIPGARGRELLHHPFGRDVAADEHRLGTEVAERIRSLLRSGIVPQVPDRHAPGAELAEAERDRPSDAA